MSLTTEQVDAHRKRAVTEAELEEHKWEVALHNERAAIEARKGTAQEKDADDRRVSEISDVLGDRKKAKPRTATRGDDAETRED